MIRDLEALKTFATVASLGSFARASDKLGISRGIASKRISGLETDLGVKLINRTTRTMSLTEAGRKLHVMADTLFGLLDSAEEDIRSETATPQGTLRVSAPMSFGIRHLGKIIDDFLLRYPEVDIEVTLDDRVVNIVEEGFDVAIRIRRLEDSSLLAKYLAPARLITCAAPSYLEKHGAPQHPRELAARPCLVYDYIARRGVWSFVRDGIHEDVHVDGRLRGNNGDVLMQAAIDGLGVLRTPTFIVHEALRSGLLAPVLSDWRSVEPALYAVMPPGRVDVLKVRKFVDHLAGALGKEPFWDRGLQLPESP
jgi:DNA-binding transcriptional LysR family regulator